MPTRNNEYRTDLNKAEYNLMRANAMRAMGFCPACSRGMADYRLSRCPECAAKGKLARIKREESNGK